MGRPRRPEKGICLFWCPLRLVKGHHPLKGLDGDLRYRCRPWRSWAVRIANGGAANTARGVAWSAGLLSAISALSPCGLTTSLSSRTYSPSEPLPPYPAIGPPSVDRQASWGYGRWNKTTVPRILTGEAYSGTWYHGKRNGRRPNPDHDLIAVEVPTIMARETWEAAQRQRARNAETASRNQKVNYLLSRRAICGTCGAKIHATARKNSKRKPTRYDHCPAPLKGQLSAWLDDDRDTRGHVPFIPAAPHWLETKLLAPAAKRLYH